MYNNKTTQAHNGRIPNAPTLLGHEEFAGCNLNSANAPTSVKPVQTKQSTTSVLRQWRRPDTVESGPKHASTKYPKVDNPGYPASIDNPAEYSMYNAHSTAVPANRPYLSHVQYGDSTGYNRASPVQPLRQDARVPDSVVKYYAQESTGEVHYRGASYPGQSTPPLAHSASAKVMPGYANNAEGHTYASGNQKSSSNYHYPMVSQSYHQKVQQLDPKSTAQGIPDEQNSYCLKSGTYPAQNRVPQHPNVGYPLQNPLDRRLSAQEPPQPYYVNKSACLSQDLRHGRQPYAVDKPGGYSQAYAQPYLAQKANLASPQEQKSREYRQIVQSPSKKSPPFPILEQRLSADSSYYPEYGAGAYAHHKYGPVMLPGATQKNYLNTSGPKFPPEDIIPSQYAKYYSQSKVAYEPNHYLLQMNQMQTRLNPNLFSRSTELPRDVAYMDQTPRGPPKRCIQYNAIEASQYGAKSSNVGPQKPGKIVSYNNVQDQHPSGEYFRNYPKPQSVIQSSKMLMDSYNMPGRAEPAHEPQSYAYSPPLIHQSNRPALAQYPTNYRPSVKTNEVSSGNISPRRTFQENMPVVVIPPQCIGLPKVSPPQYPLPGQEYPQMYQNYLPKESYYPGSNIKPGNVQYRRDQLVKQPAQMSRNLQMQASRALPTYPGAQYQHSSPDGPEKIYYPARSLYSQQVVQPANPSYAGAYSGPDYRGYDAASVVRAAYAKKEVDIGKSLKEYLESWEDDEDIVTNLPDVVLCNNIPAEKQKHVSFAEPITEAKSLSSAAEKLPEEETASQPLYILDSTNISSEALSQYLHIQQIDHLPSNIKGYYKLPGVAAPVEMPGEPLAKPTRAAPDQKLENSKDQDLKTAETKADLHARQSEGLGREAEKAESPVGKPETRSELVKPNHPICAQDYSKTREFNILEVTELRIPEISTELAEDAAESTSPQDYSVNKRGAAEIAETSEAVRFQNCLPHDFSITRKSAVETTFQGPEKLSAMAEVTVESIPQDYSINKPNAPERILLAEAGQVSVPENPTEASVIHPTTAEDYSESLQEDVALNLSTNRSKFEDNSEDSHLLRDILREPDSSIIEESTKPLAAPKLQAMLQEERDEDKVSSSNTRNLKTESYANTFSSKRNKESLDEANSVEAIEDYMEIQQKSDTNTPAVIQIHTASVIVQNTFFDDKSSSKTLPEPLVPSSTAQIVQKSHQQLENEGSSSHPGSPSFQAGDPSINLHSDSQKPLTNHGSFDRDDQNVEQVAQICSENIITIADDEPSTYSSLAPSEMSPLRLDPSESVLTATLQYNSQSFESFSADKPCSESSGQSDFEREVKQGRKKSLLDDYKQKMEENRSEQSSSECSEEEDENEDASRKRNHDRSSAIETSDSEDQELFTSDNSDEEEREFDTERTEDSSAEDVTTEGTTEATTSNYRPIMNSINEETTEEELDQSTTEEQNIQSESRPSTANNQSTVKQDETSQSTATEEDTDDPAQSTTEVKSTIQDESSQSTIEGERDLEETSTVIDEKDKEQSTIRYEELSDNIHESTDKLDELTGRTTGEEGIIPGDGSQGTTDEETTIIRDEEAMEIGTTDLVLHQSIDEVVQDAESASTGHNQAVLEDVSTEESLKDQHHDNSVLHQELASDNTGTDEDCKNLACSNNSPETMQELSQPCNKVATSNNSSELTVYQCRKLATCKNAQASVQEDSPASLECNKVASSNNSRETAGQISGQYVVLDQEIIELNSDNQEDISSVDNHVTLRDRRESISSSQSGSEDGAQCEDTASECEDSKDCNDLELHCEDSCFLGNSTDKSVVRNRQTNMEEALQSQDTKLIIDKEEIKSTTVQFKDTNPEYEARDIRRSTGEDPGTIFQFEDTDLQYEETEFNSVLHSEDEDTLRSLEELRDISLHSEDVDLRSEDAGLHFDDADLQSEYPTLQTEDTVLLSEDTLLQTSAIEAEVTLEDLTEDVSLPAEENVPELKKPMTLLNNEDNSCEANASALSDRSTSSSKSADFLIENLLSIDGDTSNAKQLQETIPADSFEREMEKIFKNIPKDPVVPETYPLESAVACLETITTIQSETKATIDNLNQPEFKLQTLDDAELQLETNSSGRLERVAETSRQASTSLEEHSLGQELGETLALPQDDLSSRDLDEDLSIADEEMPEEIVEASIATVPEVDVPGDGLSAGECLVIYGAADDFVILQEPETVSAETIVIEDDRIAGDTEELVGEQLGAEPEARDEQTSLADSMVEQMVGESAEHAQELVATLMPIADEDEKLVVTPPEQVIYTTLVDPVDKELNKRSDEKQEIANNHAKLAVKVKLNQSQELSENQNEIPVNDSLECEELQQTYQEIQVQMPAGEVKSEQDDEQLHLVSAIEVAEDCLQDIKHKIQEESPTEQEREVKGVGTIEEFKLDVKEEIVNLVICAEEVQVEDEKVEDLIDNIDLQEEVLHNKKNKDQPMRKEDDVGATMKEKKPEELVKEDLLATDTVADEKLKVELKMEDNTRHKNNKEGRIREELEESELSDQSEQEETPEVKTDLVIDDWDEPEELLGSVQLQVPISEEKKLLFARRKKNLEKLKAKFLSANQTQLDSKASLLSQIHTPAVKIPEEVIQASTAQSKPSQTTFQVSSSEVHSAENKGRRGSPSSKSVKQCQFPKYTGSRSSINSKSIDEDSFTNKSIHPMKISPRNLKKLSSNVCFNPDKELCQLPTTSTNTKGCRKPSTLEETSIEIVELSLSSKASSSLESQSSSSKAIDLCASTEKSSKSDIGGSAPEEAFQRPFRASVEDKELFINPENPRYQPSAARSFDSRKRSISYTDYSSLKIEFTAPRRRYSAMEVARPMRKPIINLDEISQNISQVLERLEKQRKVTYSQRPNTSESVERAECEAKLVTESQSKEKLMDQEWKQQNIKVHTNSFYTPMQSHPKNCEPKQGYKKLDHFKVFEKMAQRKSLKVLPVNLYDDEECLLNDISGGKVLDSGSISEETTATSALGVSESSEELNKSVDNDQRLSTDKFPTPSLREDQKITSTGVQHKETASTEVSKTLEHVDSAHHMSKPQPSTTDTVVKPSTPLFVSSHQIVENARHVTNMEDVPVKSSECVASSHHLGDGAKGRYDRLADVPSTIVDPILVLPKVSYNPPSKKICGVKNGQAKVAISTRICKSTSDPEKSPERRPGNAASKENSQEKLKDCQVQLEVIKEGKSNVPQSKEDNETVKNQIAVTASQEKGQPKMLNQEGSKLKQKGRNEDSQAKMKADEGRLNTSNGDNQKVKANSDDSPAPRVTDEDCSINVEGRKEDETRIQGTKEDGQMEVQRSEEENSKVKANPMEIKASEGRTVDLETEEYIHTKTNANGVCESGASSVQCDKNKPNIFTAGDNFVRDTVLKTSTSLFDVDRSTAKSSAAVGKTVSSILNTCPQKQHDSIGLLASSSNSEVLLSTIQSNPQAVSTGPINIKSSSSNIKVAQPKVQYSSSNAKRTSGNVNSSTANMKSGKLNAIIAKLGSANLQAYTMALKAQALHSANVSSASESLPSIADRSSQTNQRKDQISAVNRSSSVDQQDSRAGSKASTVGQLVASGASTGSQLTTAADQKDLGKRPSPETSVVDQASAKVDRHSATVNQCAATVFHLIPPAHQITSDKGKKVSLLDQRPNTVIQGCAPNVTGSPKITYNSSNTPVQCSTSPKVYIRPIVSHSSFRNPASDIPSAGSSTPRDSSKVQAVSASLHNALAGSAAASNISSSNTSSVSVIVEPTGARRKASDPRSDVLPTDVKKPEGIEHKLSNTFRLTEYTKSYIKLKMSQEMDTSIVNGLRQTDPKLGQEPIKNCSQPLKRKLPINETDTTVTAGLDKRVKINLQDYRNRKQHTISSSETKIEVDHCKNSGDDCNSSFDDCLGEVVNGIDDFMTVIETNKQYSIAEDIGNSSSESLCLDLTRRGIEMADLEIFMDDSMELIPGNEEIVHTSQEEDVLSECQENSATEELDTSNESTSSQDRIETNPTHRPPAGGRKMRIRMICKPDSAIDQARFEDVTFPGPSKVAPEPDDQDCNVKIPLPKTAMVNRTKESIPTNTNHTEPNVTNTLTRRRMKSKGEMKMYRPKRRKKRFRNLYTTDEDEKSEVPTIEMLPNDLATGQLKTVRVRPREETVASSEAIQNSSLPSCASPEDYSHLVSIEPVPYKYRTSTKKHLLRREESQETNSSSSGDLPQVSRRQGYQHRPHKRGKSRDDDDGSLPSCSDTSEAFSRKLEYKCHINLNALGNKCNMLACDPVQPSTSKMGLKLTLKSVRKETPPFSEVLGCLDSSPSSGNSSRRGKHGKRKVPRKEHSAYSVSTTAANRGWTVNDKVPKVIIKRNGSGYCAVSRDVSTNPIWQPVIRVRRHRYIESLVRQSAEDRVP